MDKHPDAEHFRITGDDTLTKTFDSMSQEQRLLSTLVVLPRDGKSGTTSDLDRIRSHRVNVVMLEGEDHGFSSTPSRGKTCSVRFALAVAASR